MRAASFAAAAVVAPANLTYSTYDGTGGNDMAYMAAAAPDGGIFTAGYALVGTTTEGKVERLRKDGTVAWQSFVGGGTSVVLYYIRDDSAGVYVVGVDNGAALPDATNTNPAPTKKTAFITAFDPATGSILRSTYLGGGGFSAANVDAIDPVTQDVYVGLTTGSSTVVEMLDPTATHVIWKIHLGDSASMTHPYGMQSAAGSGVVVATLTSSPTYPVVNAAQSSYGGGEDTGVTEIDTSGRIVWSTYMGGSSEDRPNGLDIDPSGNVYVAGRTYSADFPTLNAQQSTNSDGNAAYVASWTPAGALRYSTYLGGTGSDWFGGVCAGTDGTAWVMGGTTSPDMPVAGGASAIPKRSSYAYVAAVAPDDSGLTYATYLGGSGIDGAAGGVLVPGGFWVVGRTSSPDFPVTATAQQPARIGQFDAWEAFLSFA